MWTNRYISQTTMVDIVINLLLMISALFIMLLMIMKSDVSPPAIENLNKYVVAMEWSSHSSNDVDLWILDPSGNAVGFNRKEGNGMFLQRDDLGISNDSITLADGTQVVSEVNREVVNIRQWEPGRYHVNAHIHKLNDTEPFTISVKLYRVTPFAEYETKEFNISRQGAERTVLTFELDQSGDIQLMPEVNYKFVLRSRDQSQTTDDGVAPTNNRINDSNE